jgi:hypothetical protein
VVPSGTEWYRLVPFGTVWFDFWRERVKYQGYHAERILFLSPQKPKYHVAWAFLYLMVIGVEVVFLSLGAYSPQKLFAADIGHASFPALGDLR